jgi:hypothetical protein
MNDPSLVIKLWQSGAFLGAGIVALYLGLSLVGKIDSKRAFYYSAGAGGLAAIVDALAAGHQLQWSAVLVAVSAIVGVIAKGPDLKKPAAEQPAS